MTIGRAQCTFELYVINDEKYTDFDLGNKLSGDVSENGYDCFEQDVCECSLADEIAKDLYPQTEGAWRYVIHIYLEYTKDWEGELDSDYYYVVESKERTDYFKDMPDPAPDVPDGPDAAAAEKTDNESGTWEEAPMAKTVTHDTLHMTSIAVREHPYGIQEMKDAMAKNGYVAGVIAVTLDELISCGIEEFLDLCSLRLAGCRCLSSISYRVIGTRPTGGVHADILIEVRGDASCVLEDKD